MDNPKVYIYTDGCARGNPGPGGYGIIMEWVGKEYRKEFSEGYKHTTNNRMELLAVIEALAKLKKNGLDIIVFTDSKYVVDAVEKKWLEKWQRTAFKGKKNIDLWKRYIEASQGHKIRFQWIKGHNNHPQNERCDALAVEASKGRFLKTDAGFKNE